MFVSCGQVTGRLGEPIRFSALAAARKRAAAERIVREKEKKERAFGHEREKGQGNTLAGVEDGSGTSYVASKSAARVKVVVSINEEQRGVQLHCLGLWCYSPASKNWSYQRVPDQSCPFLFPFHLFCQRVAALLHQKDSFNCR